MRAVWRGTIGFGDYAIPVKAYAATEDHSVPLHQVHATDGGRVRVRRVCEADGEEVPEAEIVKGFTVHDEVVLLSARDLDRLPRPPLNTIDVRGFVPDGDLDPAAFAKSYYLEPEPAGTRPYVLLAEALLHTRRVAVGKVALRGRETLAALRVRDHTIVLQTLLWPGQIREPGFAFHHEDVDLRPGELHRAVALVEQLTPGPDTYTDEHGAALEDLIHARLEHQDVVRPTAREQDEGVTRLLKTLQRSTVGGSVASARAAAERAADARSRAKRATRKRGLSSST